jgi:hypothetical protein
MFYNILNINFHCFCRCPADFLRHPVIFAQGKSGPPVNFEPRTLEQTGFMSGANVTKPNRHGVSDY